MFDPTAYRTAWRILSLVCESSWSGSAKDVTSALKCSITKLTAPDSSYQDITKTLLRRICNVAVQTINRPECELFESQVEALRSGVWCLFDALVDQTKKLSALYQTLKKLRIDLDFLGTSWEKLLSLLETPDLSKTSINFLQSCMKSCLRLLAKMASCVHNDVAHESATKLQSMLHKFRLPPDLIGPAVAALAATSIVCSGDTSINQVRDDCRGRLNSLYDKCEEVISSYAKMNLEPGREVSQAEHEATIRAIYMVGEVSIIGFTPDESDSNGTKQRNTNLDATMSNPLHGLNIPPSTELLDLIMAFLPGQLLGSDKTPETARAHAFTCVGKVCMRAGQEQLAKKCVTIFAREIHENFKAGSASVQSNALLVLGDLCCRYTNLVDCHLNLMAKCLQTGADAENSMILATPGDKLAVVRKNALLLLSSLLLQDYIKLRGLLFFRFLVASTDNDETVAQIGENILIGPLLSKYPKLFFNNFIESVFVLNRCMHPIYIAAKSFGDGGAGIAVDFDGIHLNGNAGRARREAMYTLMLRRLSDEEKIGITARLVKEVLGSAVSSSGGSLHKVCTNPKTRSDIERTADREYDSAFNVLSDTFAILSSPLLRVGKSKSTEDDQDAIEDANPTRRIIAAKGKLLSKISRKHLIEICLPILSNLKVILQSSCSPLLKDLMQYMVHIYRAYKVETKDFLANDPNLLQEIEYDAKRASKSSCQKTDQPAPEEELISPSH
jgi:condensin-2 complex subunit D3